MLFHEKMSFEGGNGRIIYEKMTPFESIERALEVNSKRKRRKIENRSRKLDK